MFLYGMENINIQYTIKLISPTAYGTFPDFESRSLPSYIKTAEYTRYMVNKPFPVSEGQAAPFYWFNSSGGGTQYYLMNDISYYIEKGYIKIIK